MRQLFPSWHRQQVCLGAEAGQVPEYPLFCLSLISLLCQFQLIRARETEKLIVFGRKVLFRVLSSFPCRYEPSRGLLRLTFLIYLQSLWSLRWGLGTPACVGTCLAAANLRCSAPGHPIPSLTLPQETQA